MYCVGQLRAAGFEATVRSFGVIQFCTRLQKGGSVAEWLAWWTRAQNGPGSNRSRDAVG